MNDPIMQQHLSILTDFIVKKALEDLEKDLPKPRTHAEKDAQLAKLKEMETVFRSALSLVGGALLDFRRIADGIDNLELALRTHYIASA